MKNLKKTRQTAIRKKMSLFEHLSILPEFDSTEIPPGILQKKVKAITADSRAVKPGVVFVAIKGTQHDGHAFVAAAVKAQALAVIVDRDYKTADPSPQTQTPIIRVNDTAQALGLMAAQFYRNPSHDMTVIGVTGTSGKTTLTYLLESIFQQTLKNKKTGVIGTVNIRTGKKIIPATHTTPDAVQLQSLLSKMRSAGVNTVIMEVSSHALKQKRVAGIAFDGVCFNNLSPEHLDYHPTMRDYFYSKSLLFLEALKYSAKIGKRPVAAINTGDAYGAKLKKLMIRAKSIQTQCMGEFGNAMPSRSKKSPPLVSPHLVGEFNRVNTEGAVTLARLMNVPDSQIRKGLQKLKGVPGRMEKVSDHPLVLVDYAHKPDALKKVLQTLQLEKSRAGAGAKIWTIVGCGGDRDRQKRPVMGKIAASLSDRVIFTSDNPRTEDPFDILDQILSGLGPTPLVQLDRGRGPIWVIENRRDAIERAIAGADREDIVLIAGKGHETYQILGDKKLPFDDRAVARKALKKPWK